MPRCSGITQQGNRCTRQWRTADRGLSRGPWYCEQHRYQADAVGYTACWKADKTGAHCRKPRGHDGDHIYV